MHLYVIIVSHSLACMLPIESAGVSYKLVIHNIQFQSEFIGFMWLKVELVLRYAYIGHVVCMYMSLSHCMYKYAWMCSRSVSQIMCYVGGSVFVFCKILRIPSPCILALEHEARGGMCHIFPVVIMFTCVILGTSQGNFPWFSPTNDFHEGRGEGKQ